MCLCAYWTRPDVGGWALWLYNNYYKSHHSLDLADLHPVHPYWIITLTDHAPSLYWAEHVAYNIHVSHKNVATLFWTITPMFIGSILHFFCQYGKRNDTGLGLQVLFKMFALMSTDTTDTPNKGQNPLHQFPRTKAVTSWRGKRSVVRLLCRVVSKIPLQRLVANKLATSHLYAEVTGKRV